MALKTSLICTVLNEERNIGKLIDSITVQSKIPNEIIIADGGSKDRTIAIAGKQINKFKNRLNIKLIKIKGNRSVGRNEAIKIAKGDIILSTDSGCTLDKNWVKTITEPFNDNVVDVVAGYYRGVYKTIFQKSLIPYVLVMQDKINNKEFLPATRSMALRKYVWKKVGGFDEKLSHNEDYAFVNKLKGIRAKIVFKKSAFVNWLPRKNLKEAFIMFFRFALGDAQARLFREKVIYIFLRYIFVLYLIFLSGIERSIYLYGFILFCFLTYIAWSVWKNYKYVKNFKAIFYLPLLQFTSDFAILTGTTLGFIQSLSIKSFFKIFLNNKGVAAVIIVYVLAMLSIISYGIPGPNHPFTYFMDEWHQSQSVRNVFKYGTPNIEGSANGSMFQFFLTGIYLIPFYILKIINLFSIKSSVTQLQTQHLLFEILRFNTLLFGICSVILFAYICKKFFKLNPILVSFLFTINPLWINLSSYFKYDIALTFWLIASFLFMLRYSQKPNLLNFLMVGFFSGLSLSTKLSAIPLFPIYIILFFVFTPNFKKKIKYLILGLLLLIFTFLAFGIPDILLGRGNLHEYLFSNLIRTSSSTSYNFNLGLHYFPYLLLKAYPVVFGRSLYYLFIVSFITIFILFLRKFIKNSSGFIKQYNLYIIPGLYFVFFAISLYPLKFGANGNRVLVLLPFMVIASAFGLKFIYRRIKNIFLKCVLLSVVIFFSLFQACETLSWIYVRINPDPRIVSSEWILKNIIPNTVIGIENIPIYQMLPDIITKEFYLKQYGIDYPYRFKYQIIDRASKFPRTVILTNDEIERNYVLKSDKKYLLLMLDREGYRKIMEFKPYFKYFNILNNEFNFYISSLVQIPNTITVYEKP